jgi:ubiquinone/menaquinone biosynthesis C-methylase UbiE
MTGDGADHGRAFWEERASTYHGYQEYDENTRIRLRIAEDVGAADRVLDIGAGTGAVALEVAKRAQAVEAIDFSPRMIAVARCNGAAAHASNVTFTVQNAHDLDFPDGVFDRVIMNKVLHVMRPPQRALAEARRVLAANGLLVAPSVCAGETQEARDRARRMIAEQAVPIHSLFTRDQYCALLESCGFTVIERGRMPYRLPLEYVLARPTNRAE